MPEFRTEKDALGEKQVPAQAYWGIQTQRAIENFPVSGIRPHEAYVTATVRVKRAAAVVNRDVGRLDARRTDAILAASDEVLAGKLRDQFVVDVYQAGAGTSHNMNANEVLANRANEILGGRLGAYEPIHPNDHVNMAQSTNDVCPTAIRLAGIATSRPLIAQLDRLAGAFAAKAEEFDGIVKSGRTHLQDATPVRLGQEFGAYASSVRRHRENVARAADACREIGLGGTAVGTGLNAHPEYRARVAKELARLTGEDLRPAGDYFEEMQSLAPVVGLSSSYRALAIDLARIANDLRLLASGPRTGFGEITLPAVQPGSSIMPGKVNPVMAEMLDMVCFGVIGYDTTIAWAAGAGQLELNVMMPVVAYHLPLQAQILAGAVGTFIDRCVTGIVADAAKCEEYAEKSLSIVTAIAPHIGYMKAAEMAKEAYRTGKPIRQVIMERAALPKEKLDSALDLRGMTEPGLK